MPYKNVPKTAASITIPIGKKPAPSNANIGPGQAPAKAQPNPKIIPPKIYRLNPFSLLGNVIASHKKILF